MSRPSPESTRSCARPPVRSSATTRPTSRCGWRTPRDGRRARWRHGSSSRSTSPTCASRSRSPARASSTCGSAPTCWRGSPPRCSPSPAPASRRPSSRGRWWSTTRRRTSPSRCTSGTCARRSSATASPASCARRATRSSRRTTSATGDASSACSSSRSSRRASTLAALDLAGAEALYQRANTHLKESEEFADRARDRVVLLQAGDAETRRIWQQLIDVSLAGFNATYERMNVLLTNDDLAGESIYNADLPVVAADLEDRGIAVVDDGALVVFVDGFGAPAIIRNAARRLRLHLHRPGRHPAPGRRPARRPDDLRGRRAADAPLRAGVRGRPAGRLPAGRGERRARRLRPGAGRGRQEVLHPRGHRRHPEQPAGRGRGGGRAGRSRWRRSSTPTCPAGCRRTTPSTPSGWWRPPATPGRTCSTRTPG